MLDSVYNILDSLAAWAKRLLDELAKFLNWKKETEEKLSSVYADDNE